MIPTPALSHCFTLDISLGQPIEIGHGRAGLRRVIPITGGTATGKVSGEVINLGADWQTIFADGAAHLDTRYMLKTDDGAVIEIVNIGTRHGPADVMKRLASGEDVDPATYYMRTAARLETGHDEYAWMNHTLFLCAGRRRPSGVEIAYYEVT